MLREGNLYLSHLHADLHLGGINMKVMIDSKAGMMIVGLDRLGEKGQNSG